MRRTALTLFAFWLALFSASVAISADYDPLLAAPKAKPAHLDLTARDVTRNRDLPLRIYLPPTRDPQPVVLFSHGLGGSREGSAFLGEHWAARGYVAVFLQHPGSDDAIWKKLPPGQRLQAMQQAASLENFRLRVADIPSVLHQLEIWNAAKSSPLAGRMNMKRIGMSGHSFGAVTTQAVSGESTPLDGPCYTDPRITAAIAFSPSAPHGMTPGKAFGAVKIPWLLMTGTKDVAPIGNADMKSRLSVYPALRGAPKYEIVLNNAEHSVFTDRPLPGDREPRNPNHHRVILALSTAFWDAYLRGDADALAWLTGPGPRSVIEAQDQWQCALPR